MGIIFLLLVVVALLILLLVAGFFISLLGISITRFVKEDKSLGYFFLGIFLLSAFIFGYILIDGNNTKPTITKNEAKEILKKEKIDLKDDINIVSYQHEDDLAFYRLQFSLKISNNDFIKLSNRQLNKNYILQDVTKDGQQIHDTLKINLTKDNILNYYKSQYDSN